MKTWTKALIVAILLLLPIVGRWAWFHRGVYTPPQIAELDETRIEVPLPEYSPATEDVVESAGRVVVDMGHDNNLEVDDLSPLRDRLAARGVTVETYDGYTASLDSQLRGAVALLVAAPTYQFAEWEVDAVVDFVERGGRVLLVADPTRPVPPLGDEDSIDLGDVLFPESAIPAINSLAESMGVVFFDDYLYNLVDNEGNYRNIRLSPSGDDQVLVEDVETVVFFAAHSLRGEGPVLFSGDDNIRSSLRTGEGDLAAGVLSAEGRVLALGDLTCLTAPYHTVRDNDRFLSNLADWLVSAERRWDLRDFPYLFQRPVDLVQISGQYLDPRLFASGEGLRDVLSLADLTLELRDAADPDHDAIFVGTFDNVELVEEYLEDAGVTITMGEEEGATPTPTADEEQARDRVEVEGLGTLPVEGTTLFVVGRETDRVVVVALGEDGEAAMAALDRLAAADFLMCVDRNDVTVCSTGLAEDGLGLDEELEEPEGRATPGPEEPIQARPRVGSVLESEAALASGVPWMGELAAESYDVTSQAGETYTYTLSLERSRDLLWVYGWCTFSKELLEENWEEITLSFTLDDQDVPLSRFAMLEAGAEGDECRLYYALVTDWPRGEHVLITEVNFATEIFDGTDFFPAGTHYYRYVVTVGG
jgi:hypothetical protein